MGARPQELVNERILKDCDLLVAVFWTRLGSPTGTEISGTVEEIQQHLRAGKPAMLYFSNAPVRPDSVDEGQYTSLQEFKTWCREKGLVEEYSSLGEFRTKFARQLAQTLVQDEYFQFDGDASKEQLYLIGGRQLVKHGMNCLIVDGPGNGEALAINEIYLREDYERPAGAAIDYLETRLPHLRLAGGEARRLAGRSADRSINRGLWGGGTTQIEAPRACIRAVDPAPGPLD